MNSETHPVIKDFPELLPLTDEDRILLIHGTPDDTDPLYPDFVTVYSITAQRAVGKISGPHEFGAMVSGLKTEPDHGDQENSELPAHLEPPIQSEWGLTRVFPTPDDAPPLPNSAIPTIAPRLCQT